MDIPAEYHDREQTFLKHRVLKRYLQAWSQKMSSLHRRFGPVRLWYVDCFAGPWESQTTDRSDTSVAIGMAALEDALAGNRLEPKKVEAKAVFIEANPSSARKLRGFLDSRPNRGVDHVVLECEFGARAQEVHTFLGSDPAFVFVDPTGWKGAGMAHIEPVVRGRVRDVIVNVMFHHINRWKYDARDFLRQQMRDFFGMDVGDLPDDLDESELMRLYRHRLSEKANLDHVADLAIPHPTRNQTFFRLVVGGHDPVVLSLFRDIERRVVGKEAAAVRDKARARARELKTGQLAFVGLTPDMDSRYRLMRDADLTSAVQNVRSRVGREGPTSFKAIWPEMLAGYHITRTDLADALKAQADLTWQGKEIRQRRLADHDLISAVLTASI